jgi:hypothetical protein
MTDRNFIETHTIGSAWLAEQFDKLEAAIASQVGQATHYLSLNRTRDARIHLEQIMATMRTHHDALLEDLFLRDEPASEP